MAEETAVSSEHQNGASPLNGSPKAVSFFSLKPQLIVQAPKAADAVQFYKSAFGAEEVKRTMHPKRKAEQELPLILSAELMLGSIVFVVSDGPEEITGVKSTANVSESSVILQLETEDVDDAILKAVKAGAVIDEEIGEGACGGRFGRVKDPFGFIWAVSSKAPDVEA